MCGIIMVKRIGEKANKMVLNRYEVQKARGSEGFGFVSMQDGKIVDIVRRQNESEIKLDLMSEVSDTILFHHRYPTSTINLPELAHPIHVKNVLLKNEYYVVHNGVITNDDELKTKHEKMGFVYTTNVSEYTTYSVNGNVYNSDESVESFNDSESLAIELALYFEGIVTEIGTKGNVAFIALEVDKKGNVLNTHYGRNEGNPLVLEKTKDFWAIKSEGTGVSIEADKIYSINSKGVLTENNVAIGKLTYYASTGFAKNDYKYSISDDDYYDKLPLPYGKKETLGVSDDYNEYSIVSDEIEELELEIEYAREIMEYSQDTFEREEQMTKVFDLESMLRISQNRLLELESKIQF